MNLIVNNCKDCIFNTTGRDDTPYCKLDDGYREVPTDKTGYYSTGEIPEWCKLKTDSILIKLKQADGPK
mgnify:CR=1 FL=1